MIHNKCVSYKRFLLHVRAKRVVIKIIPSGVGVGEEGHRGSQS